MPSATTSTSVNIPELLANSPIGPLQRRVFLLCLMTLAVSLQPVLQEARAQALAGGLKACREANLPVESNNAA